MHILKIDNYGGMTMRLVLIGFVVCLVVLAGCGKESIPSPQGQSARDKPLVQGAEDPLSAGADKPASTTAGTVPPKDDSDNEGTGIMKTSISKLLLSGKSLKCTLDEQMDEGNILSETLYISGKRFRTDVLMSAMEGYEFHMISDGEWAYTWNTMSNKGTKLNLDELKGVKPQNAGQNTADLEKESEFNCIPWVPSTSMFDLPSGIEFTDDTAELKDAVEGFDAEKVQAQTCAMCEQAPSEELRQTCKENSGCP
jgi:hypothetical protein